MSLTKVTFSMIDGGIIYAKDYGAVGDGIADDTAALQAAFDAGVGQLTLLEPSATYKCTSGLVVKGDVDGRGATLEFAASVIATLVSQSVEGSIANLIIDGTGVSSCTTGLLVNTDFDQKQTCYYRIKVQNISNSNNTQPANAAVFFRSSLSARLTGDFDVSIDVENVTATANGAIGDDAGSATGIGISINGSNTNMKFNVHDCTVKNISPAEDAIAFYGFTGNHTSATAQGTFVWENCIAEESEKYSFKIQAPNATVRNCSATNATKDQAEQFTAYGYNVTFDRCVSRIPLATGGYGFATRARRTTFTNCKVFASTNSPLYAVFSGSDTCTLANCYGENTGSTIGNDNPVIRYEGSTGTVINNFVAYKTGVTDKGTVVEIGGTNCDLTINGLVASGFYRILYSAYNTGTTRLRNARVSYGSGQAAQCFGVGGRIVMSDAELTGAIGILVSTGNVFDIEVDNCVFNTPSIGVAAQPAYVRITNCTFKSDTALSGSAIVVQDVIARNNRINKFLNGIDYSNSTTAEVADNVCVDTANPFITVGVTPFVNTDNFSR